MPERKRTPVTADMKRFIKDFEPLMSQFARGINRGLENGESLSKVIDTLVIELGIVAEMRKRMLRRVDKGAAIGAGKKRIAKAKAFRKSWLNLTWPGDELTLSQRTARLGKMLELKESIRVSLKNQKTWLELATSLKTEDLVKADIAGHIKQLEWKAIRATGGDAKAIKAYKASINKSKRDIERLALNGAPNKRLKKAYQGVIKATETGSKKAIKKAVNDAVAAKAQYNAERIARTEIARAYGQGFYNEALSDEDVIGLRSELSTRHVITDICDFHAEANLYGMGPGVYPLTSAPPYPYHPNCLCVLTNVHRGEVKEAKAKDFNGKAASDYLSRQSAAKRKKMLTVKGDNEFKRNNNAWDKELRGWNGNKSVKRMIVE